MTARGPTKKPDPSSLVAAAEALEDELLRFQRLAEDALEPPLSSQKNLAKVATRLQGLGEFERNLTERMGALVQALNDLGARQQRLLDRAQARARELEARAQAYDALVGRYGALGGAAVELQGLLAAQQEGDEAQALQTLQTAVVRLGELVRGAADVEEAAREAEFVDIQRDAAGLRQQLASAEAQLRRRLDKLSPQA